jgi:hypothetical protein
MNTKINQHLVRRKKLEKKKKMVILDVFFVVLGMGGKVLDCQPLGPIDA